jgi:hypothetical protein
VVGGKVGCNGARCRFASSESNEWTFCIYDLAINARSILLFTAYSVINADELAVLQNGLKTAKNGLWLRVNGFDFILCSRVLEGILLLGMNVMKAENFMVSSVKEIYAMTL